MAKYRALNGFNIKDGKGGEVRIEQGELVDLSPAVADALKGSVEKVSERRKAK